MTGWAFLALGLLGSAALAAELPLAGNYGTAAGCAVAAQATDKPDGSATALTRAEILHEGLICPFTAVEPKSAESWSVVVQCAVGHEETLTASLVVTEHAAEHKVAVELVEGQGPAGEFAACPAP